jgi:hypothetical protein
MESDRIRPFRYHTRQTTYTHYQSPFPCVKPDANISIENNIEASESFFDIFDEIEKSYSYAKKLMDQIKAKKKEKSENAQKEVYTLSKQLSPFCDRFGRIISDVGGYMNFNMRNNKLDNLDKNLFESQSLENSLKPYSESEQKEAENEEIAKRSSRESGMNILTPVNKFEKSIVNQVIYLFNIRFH